MNRDQIHFEVIQEEDLRYEIQLYSEGEQVYQEIFRPVFSERHYLDEFPEMGLVHPSTGFIRVLLDDQERIFQKQNTDLENMWNYYQTKVLPKAKVLSQDFYQPIFSTLKMEFWLSECDEALPNREDLYSALDSFHEDLYFVGLDYFKQVGIQKFNRPLDAPGLILPLIHKVKGKPKLVWSLMLPHHHKPFYQRNGKKIEMDLGEAWVKLKTLSLEETKKVAYYEVEKFSNEHMKNLSDLIEKGASDLRQGEKRLDRLVLCSLEGASCVIDLPRLEKTLDIADFNVMQEDTYHYNDYRNGIDQLEKTRGLQVETVAKSYRGREIHTITFEESSGEEFSTSYKKSMAKPTLYINARHHANEVSSTNSTFQLIKMVMEEEDLKQSLEKLNYVFLPCENPDGVEIHHLLAEKHPHWIYHISRFNSLGKEFAHEYFDSKTIHTEALALPKVYRQWLPDVYVDDHGVPTHEWCQQFSGYTAPAYKGFWLPRALLYGYFWYPQGDAYKENRELGQEIKDAISDEFLGIEEFKNINLDLKDRFKKFANEYLPNMFPADYYKELIFYEIFFQADFSHRYLSIRYPEITKVAYTSEVADETATGKWLSLCVKAHLHNNLAIIRLMSQKPIDFERRIFHHGDKATIINKRKRK